MLLRSTHAANFSQFEGRLQRPPLKINGLRPPRWLRFLRPAGFTRWLLVGILALLCYLALLIAGILKPAQSEVKTVNAVDSVSPFAQGDPLTGEHLFQIYSAWLQTSHANAAVHGQDAPTPSQF